MHIECPHCQSMKVDCLNYATRFGGVLGAVAGAIGGAKYGAKAGFAGIVAGSITGAILGGISGCTAGISAGVGLGKIIDDNVLNNYRCSCCKYTFSTPLLEHFS